jgi:asparagine synthase (glutamine-hydrolysing)
MITSFAQELANFSKINLNPVLVQPSQLISAFPLLSQIKYQIPAWEQEFTHYFLAKEVSKKYKVTLVGDVADETHYGYHYLLNEQLIHSPAAIMQRFSNAPPWRFQPQQAKPY